MHRVGERLGGATVVVLAGLLAAVVVVAVRPGAAAASYRPIPLPGWQVDGQTYAVATIGNVVYVAGSFTTVTSPGGATSARANLAAFDATTGALLPFRSDTDGSVRALASDGSSLWVGGYFAKVGGVTRYRAAKVDRTTGAVDTRFQANANGPVYGLDVRAGRLYLAGAFTLVNGASRPYVAEVAPATGAVGAFAPHPNTTVNAVRATPDASRVYLAGNFTTVGGSARTGLASVDGTTGALTGTVFGNEYAGVLGVDLDPTGSRLYAAVGVTGNQVAAFSTGSGARLWRQRADGDVQAVAYADGRVYFGFHEGFGGDTTVRLLAADPATGALDPTFRPTFDRFWGIRALAAGPAGLDAGGDFGSVSGVRVSGLLRFPVDGTPPPTTTTTTRPTTTTTTSTTTTTTTTTAPATTTTAPVGGTTTYLGTGSTWRYWAAATPPAGTWLRVGFDDHAWPRDRSQLGFGDGDEATVVPSGSPTHHPTTYFRTTFTAPARPTAVTLSLLADDGAAVYLNGTLVAEDNVPAGPLRYTTPASANRSGAAEATYRTFTVPASAVVAGANTVAVEVHQDCTCSSDLSFDLRLSGRA